VQPDGFIQSFERLGGSNASVRTVEAAIQALSDRRCQALRIPPDQYERWRTFTITFSTRVSVSEKT
jgi:hypothetical protein